MVKNILLIDDDPISNVITRSIIHNSMVAERIMTAQNGHEGILVLKDCVNKDKFPDLIFLDLKMPVMDGYEFLNEMKTIGKSKVVILANSIDRKDLELENNFDIVDFFIKPLSLKNIREIFSGQGISEK